MLFLTGKIFHVKRPGLWRGCYSSELNRKYNQISKKTVCFGGQKFWIFGVNSVMWIALGRKISLIRSLVQGQGLEPHRQYDQTDFVDNPGSVKLTSNSLRLWSCWSVRASFIFQKYKRKIQDSTDGSKGESEIKR